ncbi:hypothetical protein ZIOFF_063053 [Zingiber officinale]|uniref:PI-PLC X domain-containing protein n=1 Tax=Zingiber officinale TaxID=94328 RepID=A0A8J5F1Z6_ZINOF|nr:hypothetical protein ZIOFF_063053 [Zingiber officinale]
MGLLSCSFLLLILMASIANTIACSNGECQASLLLEECSSDSDCQAGLYCFSCGLSASRCVRYTATDEFKIVNNSLPFNKYAYLTTHNSFAIVGEPSRTGVPRVTFTNQEDSVTEQLNNGVRALMLDTYDFEDDIWLCHSNGGKCRDFTAFEPAIDTMKEIEAFLSANPSEIVTLILEDYVETPNGLTKLFNDSGLMKYWFPVSNMPQNGQDWPLVSDMVANNQRLIVFTSIRSKQDTEGIAYQWNYMVENQCKHPIENVIELLKNNAMCIILKNCLVFVNGFLCYRVLHFLSHLSSFGHTYGNDGMEAGKCFNRAESAPLNDTSKSLVLVNYFPSIPVRPIACEHNSEALIDMLNTCHGAASNRWSNFVAVDFYKIELFKRKEMTKLRTLNIKPIFREAMEEEHFRQQICSTGGCYADVMMCIHARLGRLPVPAVVHNSNADTPLLYIKELHKGVLDIVVFVLVTAILVVAKTGKPSERSSWVVVFTTRLKHPPTLNPSTTESASPCLKFTLGDPLLAVGARKAAAATEIAGFGTKAALASSRGKGVVSTPTTLTLRRKAFLHPFVFFLSFFFFFPGARAGIQALELPAGSDSIEEMVEIAHKLGTRRPSAETWTVHALISIELFSLSCSPSNAHGIQLQPELLLCCKTILVFSVQLKLFLTVQLELSFLALPGSTANS